MTGSRRSRHSPAGSATAAPRGRTSGFGFDASVSAYHFVLKTRADGSVAIGERYVRGDDHDEAAPVEFEKATLSAYRWDRIAAPVAEEFNRRLLAEGKRASRWLKQETPLAPYFGKELALIAWAVEDADPTIIPMVVANWRGLAPEERWWFYTTINATPTGGKSGGDRGWRKAIKIAFADNPVDLPPSALLVGPHQVPEPASRCKPGRMAKGTRPADPAYGALRLFDDAPPDS